MGKKKKAEKTSEPTLSKKERKAIEKREAEIRAELERRAEKKAAKKKAKKSKAKKTDAAPKLTKTEREAIEAAKAARAKKRAKKLIEKAVIDEAPIPAGGGSGEDDGPRVGDIVATMDGGEATIVEPPATKKAGKKSKRDEVIDPESGKTRPEVIAERKAEREKSAEEIDAAIKARLEKKRAAAGESKAEKKAALTATADSVDRSDADAVRAYNTEAVKVGATLLSSDEEMGHARSVKIAEAAGLHAVEADAVEKTAEAIEALKHAVDVVETERGREFVAGESVATDEGDDFARPSEAPRLDFETNGNGQYKVARPSDGKLVGYTRVTTYIGCLEDTTTLTAWKMRLLLEGIAAAEELGNDAFTARVRDIVHNRDVAIAKARKADRKGKLGVGELATYLDGAWRDAKKALDALADEAFELGGGREKAQKGTDIHDLCALAVEKGIDAVGEKLENGEITPADLADVEAFLDALKRIGAKVVEIERVIVNDDLKVAGRLDYVLMLKLPGAQRASRYVADLKTGRVDYGTGKIAMQLGQYAEGTGYDLNTHEREDLKLNRTKAILIHLPAGTAQATVHIADLAAARRGNKLAAEVRAWRNEGKKSIDLATDISRLPATDEAA